MKAHNKSLQTLIQERSVAEPLSGCWLWTFAPNSAGYGNISYQDKRMGAHRASHISFNGAIPESYDVHHVCNNRICVNPAHLEAVTHSVNMKAQKPRKRKAECVNGHSLTLENVYEWKGNRGCRTCRTSAWKRYREKS